jgi:CelD/BcsL family acetyltransferase involved in cellulose biosynthesis
MSHPNPTCRDIEIEVEAERTLSRSEIERLWRDLEDRAVLSFFQSWTWIGTLLDVADFAPVLIVARTQGRVVGLGLVASGTRKRFGFTWPTLALNETAVPNYDRVFIEDNGFLAERGLQDEVTSACLRFVVQRMPDWSELHLNGVPDDIVQSVRALALPIWRDQERPSPVIEIAPTDADNLALLSANMRQQIRRSMRAYRGRGELGLTPSSDLAEAQDRFTDMMELHRLRWSAKGTSGAFADPFIGRFHRQLLTRGFERGEADVLRASAGTETIGLMYSFFYRGDAYAYQNGFRYDTDRRLKPGLVSHILALGHCGRRGIGRYRLLAGDSRYKRSLSSQSYTLHWLSIRRPHLAFRLEAVARAITGRRP